MRAAWIASPNGRAAAGGTGQSPGRVIVLYYRVWKAEGKIRLKSVQGDQISLDLHEMACTMGKVGDMIAIPMKQ